MEQLNTTTKPKSYVKPNQLKDIVKNASPTFFYCKKSIIFHFPIWVTKGRVQKPPARKLSVEGGGGVPPFSVNFFPLGFREPTVRGGGEGGTPPFR